MRILLTFLMMISAGMSASVRAEEVYRWIDENGQVHYSAQPPRGLNEDVYKFHVDKAADAPPPKPVTAENLTEESIKNTKVEAKRPSIDPKQAKEYCQQARDAKAKISVNFSRRYKQEDGSVRPFTDKERADMIKRADESIAAYCK